MRALLFDFGGTLDYPKHWLDRFLNHYLDAGCVLTRSALDRAFDAATRTGYRSAPLNFRRLEELINYLVGLQLAFLQNHSEEANIAFYKPAALRELKLRVCSRFLQESREGMARSRSLLSRLAERYVIGVVSNFYGNLAHILDEAGFEGIVSAIADSGQLGFYKPDTRLYAAALAALHATPETTLMVGDSIDKDCVPAQQLGIRTVWLRHREALALEKPAFVDFTINALDELQDVICQVT